MKKQPYSLLVVFSVCIIHWPAHGKTGHDFPGALDTPVEGPTFSDNLTLVGHIQLAQDTTYIVGDRPQLTDLYVAGNYAYLGSFLNRIYIVDISTPQQMRLAVEIPTKYAAVDLKIEGDLAVVGLQDSRLNGGGLLILDISAPENPQILAEMDMGEQGGVHNLFIYKQRVYIAHSTFKTDGKGLTVVDISDPTTPKISGRWRNNDPFSDVIHDVFILDGKAYLSDIVAGQGGLVIVDLEDLDRPQTLSSFAIPEGVHSAWKEGDYVYCNQEYGGWDQPLYVIDVRDPMHPTQVRRFRAEGTPDGPILGPHNPYVHNGLLF